MKIIDNIEFSLDNCQRIRFLRVEIKDLNKTILQIIETLNDMSWINKFDEKYKKESFLSRAVPTAEKLSLQLKNNIDDEITKETGEYVVSEISRQSIVNEFNYLSIPLAELLGRKVTGNPGFDFFTVNDNSTIIFGEAKYLSSQNAYGKGFSQVAKFIDIKKDISDLKLIEDFCSIESLNKVTSGGKGFAIGFSAKQDSTDSLLKNIKANQDFLKILKYEEILIVAVNI